MALTTTTLSGAATALDNTLSLTSATSLVAGMLWKIDDEEGQVTQTYASGTVIPVLRGKNGSAQVAHPSGANFVFGTAADFASPNSTVITAYALSGRRRKILSYSASGAIDLPLAGEDIVAILNGTSVLAMTVAAPTKDQDGSLLYVAANGVAAHTVTFTGGLSGASTNYDVITINATAPVTLGPFMAVNGLWQACVAVPMAGTVTNITATVA